MKNIHILPTDKPSRLGLCNNQLVFLQKHQNILVGHKDYPTTNQNIYITSDEEIKEGDWFLSKEGIVHNNWGWNFGDKKIILTTDGDLIKDGVQAIDDEFLQWFVKNPSCEEVDVDTRPKVSSPYEKGFVIDNPNYYKIIIPKEEPNQIKCYCGHTTYCDCGPKEPKLTFDDYLKQNPYIITSSFTKEDWEADIWEKWNNLYNSKEEQETLEEAAENYVRNESDATLKLISKYSFKDGAKWQQERMYSEEDMIEFHKWAFQKNRIEESDKTTKELLLEWFEQFKKK
jgi:hypothetical protein